MASSIYYSKFILYSFSRCYSVFNDSSEWQDAWLLGIEGGFNPYDLAEIILFLFDCYEVLEPSFWFGPNFV